MPLWYDGEVWCLTYGTSQKVCNLERDPRVTLQIEAGHEYDELRGVMIEAEVVIHRDPAQKLEVGLQIARRYGAAAEGDQLQQHVRSQAERRVALQFRTQ